MKKSCLAVAAFCAAASGSPRAEEVETSVGAELQAIARELMDAVAAGGREVWERRLAPQVSYVDPDGSLKGRQELLAELQPLPFGLSGRTELSEPVVTLSGDTAILSYRAVQTEQAFGRAVRAAYRVSDVYVRRDGRWLLLGSQATPLAEATRRSGTAS
jgi:uncharacterized protein DUF4440